MIRISVYEDGGASLEFNGWWDNFVDYYEGLGHKMVDNDIISKLLLEWRAINIEKTEYIDFTSEQDLMLFMLRWS